MKNPQAPAETPLLPLELWAPAAELTRAAPLPLRAALAAPRPLGADGAAASTRLIEQRLGFLSAEQRTMLAVAADSCLIRAELLSLGALRVYVEALLPDATLELHPWLAELGDAALGATLDAAGPLERGPLEVAPLPASHPLAARALAGLGPAPAVVWARRACYALRGRRVLLHEVLLAEPRPC